MVERPLHLRLLTAVKSHFQDDFLASQRKVSGEENARHSSGTQQRLKAEFLEILPGFGKRWQRRSLPGRPTEKAMVF